MTSMVTPILYQIFLISNSVIFRVVFPTESDLRFLFALELEFDLAVGLDDDVHGADVFLIKLLPLGLRHFNAGGAEGVGQHIVDVQANPLVQIAVNLLGQSHQQIGRASCRERV